jgi:hypothetical protein
MGRVLYYRAHHVLHDARATAVDLRNSYVYAYVIRYHYLYIYGTLHTAVRAYNKTVWISHRDGHWARNAARGGYIIVIIPLDVYTMSAVPAFPQHRSHTMPTHTYPSYYHYTVRCTIIIIIYRHYCCCCYGRRNARPKRIGRDRYAILYIYIILCSYNVRIIVIIIR